MQPRIETLHEKKLVGMNVSMSFIDNKTRELWGRFMPRRSEITNGVNRNLFSLQVYDASQFETFDPARQFEKWALIEVADFANVPHGMETFTLPGGQYAVFKHKGPSYDNSTFEYIFSTWLPTSNYVLDERPHFEILGEKYKNNDPNSEEEIWIPVKQKD